MVCELAAVRVFSDVDVALIVRLFMVRLQQFVRRKVADAPSDADAGPTAALRCPHGGLLPEQAGAAARRQPVPQIVWEYLVQNAEQVENSKGLGHQASQEIKLLALNVR